MMTKPPRLLILITLFVLVAGAGFVFVFHQSELPASISINRTGYPTIGFDKAKVNVVVFEEPKCSNCKLFSDEIYPKIKKEFIDTNKITYTVIPVSFLPGSMPAAIALLCVYYADPLYPNDELCLSYMDYMYEHQPDEHKNWATPDKMIEFANNASPAIDTSKLKRCIDKDTYRIKIEQNTNYGKQLMGGMISTPTVYVNGIAVKELSFEEISKIIKEVLAHEGVY